MRYICLMDLGRKDGFLLYGSRSRVFTVLLEILQMLELRRKLCHVIATVDQFSEAKDKNVSYSKGFSQLNIKLILTFLNLSR